MENAGDYDIFFENLLTFEGKNPILVSVIYYLYVMHLSKTVLYRPNTPQFSADGKLRKTLCGGVATADALPPIRQTNYRKGGC